MLPELRIRFDDESVLEALSGAPAAVMQELDRGVTRAAREVAREEGLNAPVGDHALMRSITMTRTASLERMVGPTVDYAEYVVTDVASQPRPPEQSLLDWIRVKGIQPRRPGMPLEVLAGLIADSIAQRGTPENTFIQDTHDQMADRVHEILAGSAFKALKKQGLI